MIPSQQLEIITLPSPPLEEEKLDLAKLRELLHPQIKDLGIAFKGMILSGLNVDKFDPTKVYGLYYYIQVNQVIQKSTYKSCLIVKKTEYDNLPDKSILSPGRKVEGRIVALTLNKGTDIQVCVDNIRENGLSDYEMANRRIKAECEKLGYFKREKRKRPPFFIRIGLITSSSGGVGSDIIEELTESGLPKNNIELVKCGTPMEMTLAYKRMAVSGHYDAICFFRGGNEDASMAVFRDLDLFKAICESTTFTASGLNHEQDHPVIEGIVDEYCITPTAFGKMVVHHNTACVTEVQTLADSVRRSAKTAVDKIDKELTACRGLADSYFKSFTKRLQESITTQFLDAYISVVRSITADTYSNTASVGNLFHRISAGINDASCGNAHSCQQESRKAITKISDEIKLVSNSMSREHSKLVTTLYDSTVLISREAGRVYDSIMNLDNQVKLIEAEKTARINKILLGFAAGTVSGLFAGMFSRSILVGILVGAAVGFATSAVLLYKSGDRRH